MDFSRRAEIQTSHFQHHQTNPSPPIASYSDSYNTQHHHQLYPPSLPLPTTNFTSSITYSCPPPHHLDSSDAPPRPPGIDPFAPCHYLPHSAYEAHPHLIPSAAGASHFPDLAKENFGQFGVDHVSYHATVRPPNALEPLAGANPNPIYWNNMISRSPNGAMKKCLKKTKVVQSAWCELCKIDCNSRDVYDKHIMGKKHKRNLQKLEESKSEANVPVKPTNLVVVDKEASTSNKVETAGVQAAKRKGAPAVEHGDDLETKTRKLMEGGAPAVSVRVCALCNVACNSEIVFKFHMEGQKHANQVKRHAAAASGPRVATQNKMRLF